MFATSLLGGIASVSFVNSNLMESCNIDVLVDKERLEKLKRYVSYACQIADLSCCMVMVAVEITSAVFVAIASMIVKQTAG